MSIIQGNLRLNSVMKKSFVRTLVQVDYSLALDFIQYPGMHFKPNRQLLTAGPVLDVSHEWCLSR